jgi:transposase
MYTESSVPVVHIATAFGVSRKTIYNILHRAKPPGANQSGQIPA